MKKEQSLSDPGLAGVVTEFANFLKANGFKIFQSSIHDALLSLKYINLFNKQDVFYALRSSFAKTDMDSIEAMMREKENREYVCVIGDPRY